MWRQGCAWCSGLANIDRSAQPAHRSLERAAAVQPLLPPHSRGLCAPASLPLQLAARTDACRSCWCVCSYEVSGGREWKFCTPAEGGHSDPVMAAAAAVKSNIKQTSTCCELCVEREGVLLTADYSDSDCGSIGKQLRRRSGRGETINPVYHDHEFGTPLVSLCNLYSSCGG